MYICEKNFDFPDKDDPNYSHHEVDYYAWVPQGSDISNHRLSLRKVMATGEFEVYRRFYDRRIQITSSMVISTDRDRGIETVAFRGTFEEALDFANKEYEKYHGEQSDPDKPCKHQYPEMSLICKEKYKDED